MALKFICCGVVCFAFACLVAPIVLAICRKLRASQSILHYVDKHASKNGTPTMGGFIFLLALVFSASFFVDEEVYSALFAIFVTLCFALLGFLDDFLKVRHHENAGLKPLQKIVGQVGISLGVAIFAYLSGATTLQFFSLSLDIGVFVIPFVIFVMVACTNSVNLTDGLDGLAGGVGFVYVLFFGMILALIGGFSNLAMLCFGMCGGLLGFLLENVYPAKIFMGDTGSLALGAFIGVIAVISGLELLIPLMGFMFVVSALSDIIQVLHFKRTGKRVFRMAPLHHHFEQKGVHENRIVFVYIVLTMVISLGTLAGVLIAM